MLLSCGIAGSSIFYFCRSQPGPGFWATCCWLLLIAYGIYLFELANAPRSLAWLTHPILIMAQATMMLGISRFLNNSTPLSLIFFTGLVQAGFDHLCNSYSVAPSLQDALYSMLVAGCALWGVTKLSRKFGRNQVSAVRNYILVALSAFALVHCARAVVDIYCALTDQPWFFPAYPDSIPYLTLYTGLPFLVIALVALTAISLHFSIAETAELADEARASLARFEQLMQISSSAMLLVEQGRIRLSNNKLGEMFGATDDDLQGTALERLFRSQQAHSEFRIDWGASEFTAIGIRNGGPDFLARVVLSAMDGSSYLVEIRDITQQNELELKLREMANHDPLTGLLNRRAFHEKWEITRARNVPQCLIMLDIDFFKRFNDSFGHAIGDRVLISFAQAIKSQARHGDLIARFGGEEFILLLQDCETQDGLVFLKRLREALRNARIDGVPPSYPFTFSAGLVMNRHGIESECLLREVDSALYKAKENGRDRVELAWVADSLNTQRPNA